MDEFSHLEKFAERLNSESRWESVISAIRKLRDELFENDGGWLEGQPYDDAGFEGKIHFDLYRTFGLSNLKEILEKHILSDFDFPPITADEFADIAMNQFAGVPTNDDFRWAIARTIAFVDAATNCSTDDIEAGEPIRIRELLTIHHPRLMSLQRECETIWEGEYGFRIFFTGCDTPYCGLELCAGGKFTPGAMKNIDAILKRVIPSVGTTLVILNSILDEPSIESTASYEINYDSIADDLELLEKSFFSQMLSYYFVPQAKKSSTFEQRMRNATHLLVEADDQSNRVIALSLCFSAIEAMVCEKSEGIVDELSRHVASLLEPDPLNRLNAIAGVKKLYNIRSKVLHGDAFLGTDQDYWRSRALAAAVLLAAYEWRIHTERVGAPVDRQDFLSELRTISTTGGVMVGVSASLSRFLPSK